MKSEGQQSVPVLDVTDDIEALVAPALASLPETLRRSSDPSRSIHLIDGRMPSWPQAIAAAAHLGAAGVYVLDPCVPRHPDLDDVLELATRLPVGLDLAWAGNPALAGVSLDDREPLRAVVANGSVGSASSEDLMSAAVDAVVAVSRLIGRHPSLMRFAHSTWSASAAGRWDDVVFRLSIARSAAARRHLEITAHADRRTWAFDLPGPATATPAIVTLIEPDGATNEPTVYETSHRAGLRRLAGHVRRGDALPDVADVHRTIEALKP